MARRRFRSAAVASWLGLMLFLVSAAPAPAREAAEADNTQVFAKAQPESVDDLRAIETQVRKVIETALPATVAVRVGRAHGSGVIVSRDGYVLTAAHVSGPADREAQVILSDGRRLRARTLGFNRDLDAGMIKIVEPADWPVAEMADPGSVQVGDWCLATGHPGGYHRDRGAVVRLGRVVQVRRSVVQTDCTLVGGDSGGPLYDMQGRVIGINSRIGASTAWNFHVPISAFTEGWEGLVAGKEDTGRGQTATAILGVQGEDVDGGCRVTHLLEGLPAEEAGIQVGDVITRFDGRAVSGFDRLAELVRRRRPGDEVSVVIERDGRTMTLSVELAGRENF